MAVRLRSELFDECSIASTQVTVKCHRGVRHARKTGPVSQRCEGDRAIGYQLELRRASKRVDCGQILKTGARYNAAKYNRYVTTDPTVFKTTAIDHSAIPPRSTITPEIRAVFASSILNRIPGA